MVFRFSVEDEYDVHVSRFGFWCTVEVPFVEGCSIKECSSIVPGYSERVFGGIFCSKKVSLK